MIRRYPILKIGSVEDKGPNTWPSNWELHGWEMGCTPFKFRTAPWHPKELAEISEMIGEGRSLVQCFFCDCPIIPAEVPITEEVENLCMRAFGKKRARPGCQIGERVMCFSCWVDLQRAALA